GVEPGANPFRDAFLAEGPELASGVADDFVLERFRRGSAGEGTAGRAALAQAHFHGVLEYVEKRFLERAPLLERRAIADADPAKSLCQHLQVQRTLVAECRVQTR